MSPIPINASMGMLISLGVAFSITPWLALRLAPKNAGADHGPGRLDRALASGFSRLLEPFVDPARGSRRRVLLGAGIVAAIVLSVSLAAVQWVVLKMLPFDNKSEFRVVVDLPAGAPVEATAAALADLAAHVATLDEVTDVQTYAGTASPINFNGLVRHYFLRRGANIADIQVNLLSKDERRRAEPLDRETDPRRYPRQLLRPTGGMTLGNTLFSTTGGFSVLCSFLRGDGCFCRTWCFDLSHGCAQSRYALWHRY